MKATTEVNATEGMWDEMVDRSLHFSDPANEWRGVHSCGDFNCMTDWEGSAVVRKLSRAQRALTGTLKGAHAGLMLIRDEPDGLYALLAIKDDDGNIVEIIGALYTRQLFAELETKAYLDGLLHL